MAQEYISFDLEHRGGRIDAAAKEARTLGRIAPLRPNVDELFPAVAS